MSKKTNSIYQFKITLKDIKPKIWRRIQVPEKYSFWDLHVAIQDAMGWDDYHLHQFEIINPKTMKKDIIGIPDEEWPEDTISGAEVKIAKYFLTPKDKAIYEYDFGDGWEHEVILEKILPEESNIKYPKCIAGERACPPEDCGGTWGYSDLLEIIANPEHEEYNERMEWIGDEFNPEKFAPEEVEFDDPKERWKIAFT
jgi:hypothetical protein